MDFSVRRFRSLLCQASVTRSSGFFRMLEDVMAAGAVMDEETGTGQHAQHVLRSERGQAPAHADSGNRTRISSYTGDRSAGIGRWSLCKLSGCAISRASSNVSPSVTRPGKRRASHDKSAFIRLLRPARTPRCSYIPPSRSAFLRSYAFLAKAPARLLETRACWVPVSPDAWPST